MTGRDYVYGHDQTVTITVTITVTDGNELRDSKERESETFVMNLKERIESCFQVGKGII
jgi:hypothetical protein